MRIEISCYPVCDVINFEIDLSFLIKSFLFMTKKSAEKVQYLKKSVFNVK